MELIDSSSKKKKENSGDLTNCYYNHRYQWPFLLSYCSVEFLRSTLGHMTEVSYKLQQRTGPLAQHV